MSESEARWNRKLHLIKRLVEFTLFLVIAGLFVYYNVFSPIRLALLPILFFAFSRGSQFVHRQMAARYFGRSGFRLEEFLDGTLGRSVSYSFDWPWWCDWIPYDAAISFESGDLIDIHFVLEGPLNALIYPKIHFQVLLDHQDEPGELSRVIKCLPRLQTLTSLSAHYAKIDDVLLGQIALLENLEQLNLSRTQLTDAGLNELKGLVKLKELELVNTRITDLGLQSLNGMTTLEILVLNETDTSKQGRDGLRAALPDCRIWPQD